MILLRQASPIANGAPALLYHYGDPSGCRHSPSSDNKQWSHGHVHWSFYSWWILKIQGQSMGIVDAKIVLGSEKKKVVYQQSRYRNQLKICFAPGMREEYTVSLGRLQCPIRAFCLTPAHQTEQVLS
ncbi:hypothetical protein TNCV_3252071 [Trichonephila clavipes]|nr:hypothetical protein TNCV_3252071 [Trichonephila clavipes]